MMLPVAIGYLYRISIEERFMGEQHGEDYRIYQVRTKKIIPFLY
jgi:protein-S-isoprenylcysteine O-methyltransferase Ste14